VIGWGWPTLGVLALSAAGVCVPTIGLAQHGPGRHGLGTSQQEHGTATHAGPVYDPTSEVTFQGVVEDVKSGRSVLSRVLGIHTFGVGPKGMHEKVLLLKTGTETIAIRLAPTAFLKEQRVEIGEGDTLEVIGSRVAMGDAHVVLAREIRKGDSAWTLRDSAGQPLWASSPTEARGFWTRKKVLLVVVAAKVVLLATVLRH
jgi:hypothetical protein